MKKRQFLLPLGLLLLVFACSKTAVYQPIAQKYEPDFKIDRLEKEILNYEQKDAALGIEKLQGKTIFYGSSSIRFWKTLAEDFSPLEVINHGFGGSTFPEMSHYADRMLFKYKPQKIVLYCENDLFMGKPKTPEQAFDDFAELATKIQNNLPKTKVYYISMKPSISRKADWLKVQKIDSMIVAYIKKHRNFQFIDIRPVMYKADGSVNGTFFVSDSLHMTAKGYEAWTKVVRPIVLK